jgi:phosphopantothenoylcysteine synthetase/decarboxylase
MKLIKCLAMLRLLILIAALSTGVVNSALAKEEHKGKGTEAVEKEGDDDEDEDEEDDDDDDEEDDD